MKLLTITALFLIMVLSACAAIDNIGDTSRTDAVQVRLNVETVSAVELAVLCTKPSYLACFTSGVLYLQGIPDTYSLKLIVQYLSWADLGDKCGRFTGGPACYEGNTLFLSSTTSLNNGYQTGVIGDLLAEQMGIEIGLNRRAQLGHEFLHALGKLDSRYFPGPEQRERIARTQ